MRSTAQFIRLGKTTSAPYNALAARCPKCRAARGRSCISASRKRLRYPHRERIERAAADYRSQVRRKILDRTRRGPFANAFSERRMAVEGFSTLKVSVQEEGRLRVGGRGFAAQRNDYAQP
jgi:hypothetical protein